MSHDDQTTMGDIAKGTFAIGAIGALAFVGLRYKVCRPEQVMIRTGLGIKEMSISKKGIQWPLQKVFMIDMMPKTFSFNLQNMSQEKVEFKLPVTFTISPIHSSNDEEGFKRYANYINGMDDHEFADTLGGMIEGEMRILTASMTVDEMFSNKEKFQEDVVDKISVDLNKLGIRIVNANIKEMADLDDKNKFFEYRKQRAIQTANYEAQKDVSRAQKEGEIGVATQEAERKTEVARLHKEYINAENLRKAEIALSQADLAEAEALSTKRTDIANVEAKVAAQERQVELEKQLFIKTQEQELEKQRSEQFIKAKVTAESLITESEGQSQSTKLIADAEFYKKQKEADGIYAIYEAQANGLNKLLESSGNNPDLAKFQLAIDKNLFPELARHGADAVKGMNPEIKIWNTGSGSDSNDPSVPITKLVQSLSPLMQGMKDQGGMIFPSWLPHVSNNVETSTNDAIKN